MGARGGAHGENAESSSPLRWERRQRKRDAARRRMRVDGRGVITVLSALEVKRERDRRAKETPVADDPILGPTEVWDTDALTELEGALLAPARKIPRPFRCRTGAVPGTKGTSKKVLSFYLKPEHTADAVPQFYISPLVGNSADAIRLLAKLACEAIYPNDLGDQLYLGRVYFGITWSTRTPVPVDIAGEEVRVLIPDIIANLGPRPHGAAVSPEVIRTPKTTALLRSACPYCDTPFRATLSALKEAWPVCVGAGPNAKNHAPVFHIAQGQNDGGAPTYHRASGYFTTTLTPDGRFPAP